MKNGSFFGTMNRLGDTCIEFKEKWERAGIHTGKGKKKRWCLE